MSAKVQEYRRLRRKALAKIRYVRSPAYPLADRPRVVAAVRECEILHLVDMRGEFVYPTQSTRWRAANGFD